MTADDLVVNRLFGEQTVGVTCTAKQLCREQARQRNGHGVDSAALTTSAAPLPRNDITRNEISAARK